MIATDYCVAITCVHCGELILTFNAGREYCGNCVDIYNVSRIDKRLRRMRINDAPPAPSPREQYRIAKDYMHRMYRQQLYEQRTEELGTYATTKLYKQNTGHPAKKKDGDLDVKTEIGIIRRMKKGMMKPRRHIDYNLTEGDIIRNPKED